MPPVLTMAAMRPLVALAVYIVFVFVGGALLAPGLHGLVAQLGNSFDAFQKFSQQPFSRYLNRCFLLLALVGLWPLVKAFGIKDFRDLGLRSPGSATRPLLKGMLVGFLTLALLIIVGMALGARIWNASPTATDTVRHVFKATLAAVVVGILEEILFRGAIFGSLRRTYSAMTALAVSSGVFSIVHFFARVQWQGEIHWHSGLVALPQMLAGFTDVQQLVPGFFNLTLVGIILARVFALTGSLYASIGLHAGWIFWLKTGGFFTQLAPATTPWIWGSNKLVDGWMALPLLLLAWLGAEWLFSQKPEHQPAAP